MFPEHVSFRACAIPGWKSLEGYRVAVLLCNPDSGQHIQSVFTRKVYCSLVCKHHCVEFMNSCFLLAQSNRGCFLIGSHDGELTYACLAQVTFLLLVLLLLLLPLLLSLKQGARRRTPCARHCCRIHEPSVNDLQFTFLTVTLCSN